MRRALAPLVVAALLLGATRARADATTEADALFDEGLKAMDAGDHAAACAKFGESQRLDPAAGTLLHLGNCYEKVGKTASAWATFLDAAASEAAPCKAGLTVTRTTLTAKTFGEHGYRQSDPAWRAGTPLGSTWTVHGQGTDAMDQVVVNRNSRCRPH